MIDKNTLPAPFFNQGHMAEVFYELHCLCEQDLNLSMRQRNLISLGYLLYGSNERQLLITTLNWASPELVIETHQLMRSVCHKGLLALAEKCASTNDKKLIEYHSLERIINRTLRELKKEMKSG